jgi:hypothetical protein
MKRNANHAYEITDTVLKNVRPSQAAGSLFRLSPDNAIMKEKKITIGRKASRTEIFLIQGA